MPATELATEVHPDTHAEIDPIKQVYEGECPSISGRSTLTFAIGRHEQHDTWHLRITGNSGKGMWFDGWASASDIDNIVNGATELTAQSFHRLHARRSINTGGFIMACLRHLGLIRVNSENSRHHEHVPTETFDRVSKACIGGHQSIPPKRRKAKEVY